MAACDEVSKALKREIECRDGRRFCISPWIPEMLFEGAEAHTPHRYASSRLGEAEMD